MLQGLLAAMVSDTKYKMLDGRGSGLPVHQVSINQCVFQQAANGENVVLAHFSDVLEHEAETLEDTVLHVHLRHPILVHQRRQDCKGSTRLRHDSNGYSRTKAVLPLLYP